MSGTFGRPCPCGSGATYEACCQPLHHGERRAGTAEELMRSRYSAYATGNADYLFRTWHPRTRPADVPIDVDITWIALEVIDATARDDHAEVEFVARYEADGRAEAMHERSRFECRRGWWLYVDDANGHR